MGRWGGLTPEGLTPEPGAELELGVVAVAESGVRGVRESGGIELERGSFCSVLERSRDSSRLELGSLDLWS